MGVYLISKRVKVEFGSDNSLNPRIILGIIILLFGSSLINLLSPLNCYRFFCLFFFSGKELNLDAFSEFLPISQPLQALNRTSLFMADQQDKELHSSNQMEICVYNDLVFENKNLGMRISAFEGKEHITLNCLRNVVENPLLWSWLYLRSPH